MFSPVALFVYNRVDNTRATLRALMANTLAAQTDLYVFSDGGKDETSWAAVREVRALLHEVEQEVARTRSLLSMTIVERPVNYYLERNVIEGINQVLERHETIIVLEDDIVTSPHFLQFMNDAFAMYRDEQRVMHVSGFTRLSHQPSTINHQPSTISHQPSAISHQPSTISHQSTSLPSWPAGDGALGATDGMGIFCTISRAAKHSKASTPKTWMRWSTAVCSLA